MTSTSTQAPASPKEQGPTSPAGRRRPRRSIGQFLRAQLTPVNAVLVIVVVIAGWLALVPLIYLVWGTLTDGGQWTLAPFGRAFALDGLGSLLGDSLTFTIGATVVSVVVGTVLAFLTERTNVRFKKIAYACALLPIIIPGVLYTISWVFIAAPRTGVVNRFLHDNLHSDLTLNVFSMPGMIWVQGLDSVPLVFLLMVAAFRSFDSSIEEAALTSGASLGRVIRSISAPLALPAIFSASLLMFIQNIEAFETPAILGIPGEIWVFSSRIWEAMQGYPPDTAQAGAFSIALMVITGLAIFWHSRYSRNSKRFATVTGKSFRPRPLPLGRWRGPATALVVVYFAIAVLLPMLMMVYFSFQKFLGKVTWDGITQPTLRNYEQVFHNQLTVHAFLHSIILAVGAATFIMVLSGLGSWITVRAKVRGRWLIEALTFLPFVLPGLVIGVSLLIVYLRAPVPIYGTLWILFLAYAAKGLPYGMRFSSTSMLQISGDLEESGQVSGASWWQGFRRITLPLLMPGLIGGWVYIVLVMMRELTASVLLYSPGNEVLSVMIWSLYNQGDFNQLSALGVLMMIVFSVIVLVAQRLGGRFGVGRN